MKNGGGRRDEGMEKGGRYEGEEDVITKFCFQIVQRGTSFANE